MVTTWRQGAVNIYIYFHHLIALAHKLWTYGPRTLANRTITPHLSLLSHISPKWHVHTLTHAAANRARTHCASKRGADTLHPDVRVCVRVHHLCLTHANSYLSTLLDYSHPYTNTNTHTVSLSVREAGGSPGER